MNVFTPAELRTVESASQIPEETLMEAAATAAAHEILVRYWPELKKGPTTILCGPGHNGADGLAVARHLRAAGVDKIIVCAVKPLPSVKPLFRLQWDRLEGCDKRESMEIQPSSLIIDALYGIGLKGGIQEPSLGALVGAINNSKSVVVSLDAPSGLDCETGQAMGPVVEADLTLTFGFPKPGFYTAKGTEVCGVLRVLPIGLSVPSSRGRYHLFEEKWAQRWLPKRPLSGNKSTFGHLAVFAGRPGFWGAGVLCSHAAFRVGAGYVTWASDKEEQPLQELRAVPEVLTASRSQVLDHIQKYSAWVVGPGFGPPSPEILAKIRETGRPAVFDADALATATSERLPDNWILTPHSGELARLLGVSSSEIEANRFAAVETAGKKFGGIVVLKGFRTLVADQRRSVIIPSGNPALAKAGSGDVLAGFIGGFLAQGLSAWKATCLAAYLHGRLADEWVRAGKDVSSLMPSDLATGLPELMHDLRTGSLRLQRSLI